MKLTMKALVVMVSMLVGSMGVAYSADADVTAPVKHHAKKHHAKKHHAKKHHAKKHHVEAAAADAKAEAEKAVN